MKRYRLFILFFLFLAFSCSKSDDGNQELPEIPQSKTYDLNGDTIDDFTIEYALGVWDGFRASGLVYSANFVPERENKILSEYEENVSTTFLFSQRGDTIRRIADSPQEWDDRGRLHRLWQSGDGVWSKEWSIANDEISNPYYAGVQIKEGDTLLVGWLKLEIDTKTGEIAIADYELTSKKFIVVD